MKKTLLLTWLFWAIIIWIVLSSTNKTSLEVKEAFTKETVAIWTICKKMIKKHWAWSIKHIAEYIHSWRSKWNQPSLWRSAEQSCNYLFKEFTNDYNSKDKESLKKYLSTSIPGVIEKDFYNEISSKK